MQDYLFLKRLIISEEFFKRTGKINKTEKFFNLFVLLDNFMIDIQRELYLYQTILPE